MCMYKIEVKMEVMILNKNKHRIAIGALSSQLMIGAIMAVSAGEVNVAFADEVLNIQNKNA